MNVFVQKAEKAKFLNEEGEVYECRSKDCGNDKFEYIGDRNSIYTLQCQDCGKYHASKDLEKVQSEQKLIVEGPEDNLNIVRQKDCSKNKIEPGEYVNLQLNESQMKKMKDEEYDDIIDVSNIEKAEFPLDHGENLNQKIRREAMEYKRDLVESMKQITEEPDDNFLPALLNALLFTPKRIRVLFVTDRKDDMNSILSKMTKFCEGAVKIDNLRNIKNAEKKHEIMDKISGREATEICRANHDFAYIPDLDEETLSEDEARMNKKVPEKHRVAELGIQNLCEILRDGIRFADPPAPVDASIIATITPEKLGDFELRIRDDFDLVIPVSEEDDLSFESIFGWMNDKDKETLQKSISYMKHNPESRESKDEENSSPSQIEEYVSAHIDVAAKTIDDHFSHGGKFGRQPLNDILASLVEGVYRGSAPTNKHLSVVLSQYILVSALNRQYNQQTMGEYKESDIQKILEKNKEKSPDKEVYDELM